MKEKPCRKQWGFPAPHFAPFAPPKKGQKRFYSDASECKNGHEKPARPYI